MRGAAVALVLLLASGCATTSPGGAGDSTTASGASTSSHAPPPPLPDPGPAADADAFAWRLFAVLAAQPGNHFFSPHSIREAFAVLSEGAKGTTQEQILDALGLPHDVIARRKGMEDLHDWLNRPASGVTIEDANALWVQRAFELKAEFSAVCAETYDAHATNVDFVGETEGARSTINAWVEQRTRGKIKDLFPTGSLTPETRLAITNAIYFNGTWAAPFNATHTVDAPFHAAAGDVSAHLMKRTGMYGYAERNGVQALRLPYNGNNVSMVVLLPVVGGLDQLEGSLNAASMNEWRRALAVREVRVELPKFTMTANYPTMKSVMGVLGIQQAFSTSADLSGIAGNPGDLMVTAVVHKAFVAVDEHGTEAAAATGIAVGFTAVPPEPPVFRADRPFVFVIQDDATGALLFMGRLAAP